jgi:hypothetical protein
MKNLMIFYLLLFILTPIGLFSQNTLIFTGDRIPILKSYICYKSIDNITVDGNIKEKSWEKSDWTDFFVDIEGSKKPEPRYKTRVKMLWDDKYFYVAAELEEPYIWATLKNRDAIIFYDNDFEVFIDPDGDTHQYVEFEMNALNTIWDLLLIKPYRDDGPILNLWDIKGLKTGVKIYGTINNPNDMDKKWTVEIAFPWEVFKECTSRAVPPLQGDQWRVNFSRVEWKTEIEDNQSKKIIDPSTSRPYPEDNWVWSPQEIVNMHCPEMWGFVQFSDKLAGQAKDIFVYNPEENVKWALRQVYYAEKKYFIKNKHYIPAIDKLDVSSFKLDGYNWPPEIQCTENQYEAIFSNIDGKIKWHISQDGRVWKSEYK